MLAITNNGQTEALSHYTGYELNEEVNGALMLSLTSFNVEENAGHGLVEGEAVIRAKDGRDFRIKQPSSTSKRKQVTAISTFFDLVGHRKDDIYGGTRTFNEFASWLFAGTGWTFESVDVSGSMLIPNYGNENFLKLLEVLLSTYECERQIMPGNHIVFKKQIGSDNDAQYRFAHNIKTLSYNVDTTNLRTSITGYGGNGLVVTYTSPNAIKFPHAGEAEPVEDDRFTLSDSLIEYIKQSLIDYPEVSIEVDALELTEKELGERVWLIHEPLGIEFQTRILSKTTREPKEKSSAVIGNSIGKTITDKLSEQNVKIDENNKQTRSRFEQTNEKIELAVERFDGEILEAYSYINLTADNIRLEVGNVADDVAAIDIKANAIVLSVSGLTDRLGTAEASISIQAGEISQKVSSTDFNGETIISKVSQTSSAFKIDAKNIQLDGIVEVANRLNLGKSFDTGEKSIIFGNNSSIHTPPGVSSMEVASGGGNIHLYGSAIRFDGYHAGSGSAGSVLRIDTAQSVVWGSHAPNTTAKFG